MMIRFILTFLLSTSLLTGCGFHLRGKVTIPPQLSTMYVAGEDAQLVIKIEQALRDNGVTIVKSGDAPTAVLNLTRVNSTRTVSTLDDRGKATGYVLNYLVTFTVADKEGKTLLKQSAVILKRDFNFDSTQVLQKEGEEEFLVNDMRNEATRRILSKLGRIVSAHRFNWVQQFAWIGRWHPVDEAI